MSQQNPNPSKISNIIRRIRKYAAKKTGMHQALGAKTPAPIPTPLQAPAPTPLPAPIPTPLPAPIPTPLPAPIPTPLPAPIPTPLQARAPLQAPAPKPEEISPRTVSFLTDLATRSINAAVPLTPRSRDEAMKTKSKLLSSVMTRQPSYDTVYPDTSHWGVPYIDRIIASLDARYSNFYNTLTRDEMNLIANYSSSEDIDYNNAIERVFDKLPTTPNNIRVYRCYQENVTLNTLRSFPNNQRFLSTSLSQKFALHWCGGVHDPDRHNPNLMVCIIIPKGSKGVLPLLKYFKPNFKNNYLEILLDRRGRLVSTGIWLSKYYPYYPIFYYFDPTKPGENVTDQIRKTIEQEIKEELKSTDIDEASREYIKSRLPTPSGPRVRGARIMRNIIPEGLYNSMYTSITGQHQPEDYGGNKKRTKKRTARKNKRNNKKTEKIDT